ncbi:MAG: type I glyceraldehyde-3-phosphate dehydrogenase [Thermoleophilia bacterium]|nr:type I glyceraldehyde-3-phosphate dehydrogenase [Thermoleophilia bacterium]
MATKVAINGFGRIGRLTFRQIMESGDGLEVVAINDVADLENLAYLLLHDSVYSSPDASIGVNDGMLSWDDRQIPFTRISDPEQLPWGEKGVETVIEASGAFTARTEAGRHLDAGAERVLVTAPSKGADITICMGVNEDKFDPSDHLVISNASCTTNCLAPVAKVLDEEFGIVEGLLTTVHALTSGQGIVDKPGKDWRRGRAGAHNIVPATTGAAIATAETLPQLRGKVNGMAMRVPVLCGSVIDFVANTERTVDEEKVNEAIRRRAAAEEMRGILGISEEPLVSSDIIGSTYSAVVDASSTMAINGHTVKVVAWYDNEWGYARRVVDAAGYISRRAQMRKAA